MKKILRHVNLFAVICVILCAISFSASAAGEIYTEDDGVRTAYLSSSETVTLDDDTTRNAYNTFSAALNALGADGGRIYVCGTVDDATADGAFTDVVRTTPVLVTGLSGDGTDILNIGCTMHMGGSFTFENFTMNISFSGGRYMTGGPGTKTFGEGFKIGGNLYYRNYNKLDTSVTEARTVFASDARFVQISAGGDATDIGSLSAAVPALAELVFDNVNYGNAKIRTDYNNTGTKVMYANVNIIVNGGTFQTNTSIAPAAGNQIKGVITAILNNDTASKITTYDATVDYVVKSSSGGLVSIKKQADYNGAPTFVFDVQDGKLPLVNGAAIAKNADGEYTYTPEVTGVQQILTVTYADAQDPIVYIVDGERCAFVSSQSTVTVNGESYLAFDGFTSAIATLGQSGGKIILASDITEATFTDVSGRAPVVITGLTGNEIYSTPLTNPDTSMATEFVYLGDLTLDNFTFKNTSGVDRCIVGSEGASFTTGEKFQTTGANLRLITVSDMGGKDIPKDVKVTLKGSQIRFVIMRYSRVPENRNITVVLDGVAIPKEYPVGYISLGYIESAKAAFNGSFNLIINKETKQKNITSEYNAGGDSVISSDAVYSVIFNNGINSYTFSDTAELLVDYKVYSALGGNVSVYSNGNSTTAPTFLLTPEGNNVPKVDGKFLASDGGVYKYTPALSDNVTTINVTWESADPSVYEDDDKYFAFVKAGGGGITFNDSVYFAYNDINTAVAALGTGGGTIYVLGTVEFIENEPYDTNTFKDTNARQPLSIIGLDGTSPVLNYYRNMSLGGDLTMDNITYHRLNGTGTLYDTGFIVNGYDLTIGKSFVTTSDFYSQVMTIHGAEKNITFDTSTIDISGGTITRIAPGSNYAGVTLSGNTVINIKGGKINTILGGSHGGASTDSIYNGNVTYNISAGNVENIYTGVNTKTGINGNVTVNITGGNFSNANFYHGNKNISDTNYLSGNSVFIISGGNFDGARLGDVTSRGVTGEEIFIISKDISGYNMNTSAKTTIVLYNAKKGTVAPAYDNDNQFVGYTIAPIDATLDVLVDGVKAQSENGIYTISRGEHTVEFAKIYEISFDLNGAAGTSPDDISEYNGTALTLSAPTAEYKNNTFVGWSEDKNASVGTFTYTVPEKNVTLYAIWKETKTEIINTEAVEASDASEIIITTITEDKYDTHSSVIACASAAESDEAVLNGADVVYAFSIKAYYENAQEISNYNSAIKFRVPLSVLTIADTGEFYRIYKVSDTGVSTVKYTSDDEYLYFTDHSSGDYTIMKANALYAKNSYIGKYDSKSKKYVLELYFHGADACYGSFGIKYDTTLLSLDSFVFAEGLSDHGNISVADGGFSTYYNENGIYQNTWSTQAGIFASGNASPVKIGTFTFSLSGSADGITEAAFSSATVSDTGISLDEYTLGTVYSGENYMYAPMTASTEVYPQPINTEFNLSGQEEKYTVALLYNIEREYGNEYFCKENVYDGRASITIKNADNQTVAEISESECTFKASENGKTVISASLELECGSYTATFRKNGYVTVITLFDIVDGNVERSVTPISGDIKNSFEDLCGDGSVDIDDFIRVLRGFDSKASEQLSRCVDINEDGVVNVSDIAVIKANFGEK